MLAKGNHFSKLRSHRIPLMGPHPVIVAIRDNKDYIRALLFSYSTTITGCGVLLMYTQQQAYPPRNLRRHTHPKQNKTILVLIRTVEMAAIKEILIIMVMLARIVIMGMI